MKASGSLDRAIRAADDSISGKGMLAAIMVEWKGVAGLARELRSEYEQLPEGHPNKAKILMLIIQAELRFGGGGEDDGDDLDALEEAETDTIRELAEIDDESKAK